MYFFDCFYYKKKLKNENNVTNFGCVFVTRCYITFENFLRNRRNSFMVRGCPLMTSPHRGGGRSLLKRDVSWGEVKTQT